MMGHHQGAAPGTHPQPASGPRELPEPGRSGGTLCQESRQSALARIPLLSELRLYRQSGVCCPDHTTIGQMNGLDRDTARGTSAATVKLLLFHCASSDQSNLGKVLSIFWPQLSSGHAR